MPRQLRIQYPGALYHITARGDRREEIVHDDGDREMLLATLAEACKKTQWEVLAWVIMDNHYHWLLRTPKPNLVAGMSWFQGTYTQRYNARHRVWGHLFGGRYKAIPVQPQETGGGDYLKTLMDYIHLNPVRAGVLPFERLLEYPWSSFRLFPRMRRPSLLEPEVILRESGGWADTRAGWNGYREHLRAVAAADAKLGDQARGRLSRGWALG